MATTRTLLPDTYDELVGLRPLRPIRDDAELNDWVFFILRLNNIDAPTKDQKDYIDVVHLLMEQYEATKEPIDLSGITQVDMLEHYLEIHGMTASDLDRVIGTQALGNKILRGERGLSKANILALSKHFHVSPELFHELKPGTKPKKAAVTKRPSGAPKKVVRKSVKKRTTVKR